MQQSALGNTDNRRPYIRQLGTLYYYRNKEHCACECIVAIIADKTLDKREEF